MKTRTLVLVAVMIMGATSLFAQQERKEKFTVAGNCGMCETRIENAAKEVEGVVTADWNKDTKILEVVFNKPGVEMKDVQKACAKVGHDTEMFKAEKSVYDALPGCCHYERMTEKEKEKVKM